MKFTEVASFVFLTLLGGAVRGEESCGLVMGVAEENTECGDEILPYIKVYAAIAYEKECNAYDVTELGGGDARALVGEEVCDNHEIYCDMGSYYSCYVWRRDCQRRLDVFDVPTPAKMTVAVADMETAYTQARLTPNSDPDKKELNGGHIGGLTLTPGVYTFTTGITISSDIFLDGPEHSVFIMQTTGVLSQAANTRVHLTGGVKAQNVFWQVAGNAVVLPGATMQGILLVKTDVAFQAGSALIGSIFSQTACNIISATITKQASTDISSSEPCGTAVPCEYNIDPINLGTAGDFAILAKSGISTVPTSIITGDIGVSPIAVTAITGFSLALAQNGVGWTSAQVTGKCYGPDIAAQIAEAAAVTTPNIVDPFGDGFEECNNITWGKFLKDVTENFLDMDSSIADNVKTCFSYMFCRVKKA